MPNIIGFNLKKISAERKENIKTKVEIKSNIDILDIKKEVIDISKDKEVLSFTFNFAINYEPKIANLAFEGNVLLLVEPAEAKDILKRWKKKLTSQDIRLIIFNTIMTRCNIKALELEENIGLPSHIPLPKLSPPQQNNTYTG